MTKKKIFACRTMEAEIREVLPEDVDCEFLEYGLHSYPDKLRQELQLKIEEAGEYDTLLFGYGLCSNVQPKGQNEHQAQEQCDFLIHE
jgi:hypothetical protein